jgi:hypothetical protein
MVGTLHVFVQAPCLTSQPEQMRVTVYVDLGVKSMGYSRQHLFLLSRVAKVAVFATLTRSFGPQGSFRDYLGRTASPLILRLPP